MEKRIPKTGDLIQVVAAEPTESRPYSNGDVFEVGYVWHYEVGGVEGYYGGVTTVQNVELYDREFVLLDELYAPNPHAEVFGSPMGAEFGSDEYEFLHSIGATGPAYVMTEEPTVEFIGEPDMVKSPPHYTQGGVEVIDIIRDAVEGAKPFEAVCQANALKYLLRYRHKNGVEDLRKCQTYLRWLIDDLEK